MKVFLQSCLSNKIISWPSFRNPGCLSIITLITPSFQFNLMRTNNNNDEQLAWQCSRITTWEVQLFTFTVAMVLRRPLQLWRYPSIFDFLYFFQCVLMVSLYQTGGNLWRNPAASCPRGPASRKQDCRLWMRHLQEHLRAASIKKRKERERETGSLNGRAANQTRCVRLLRGNPTREPAWRLAKVHAATAAAADASGLVCCVSKGSLRTAPCQQATWWQAASLHTATAMIGSFLRWMQPSVAGWRMWRGRWFLPDNTDRLDSAVWA